MSFSLNPFKALGNLIKAPIKMITDQLMTPFNAFKDLITGHPIKALEEPFKTLGKEFSSVGTILSLGTYTGNVGAPGAAPVGASAPVAPQ